MATTENYNPDVLTCLANLSSDEVFTPPEVANRVLDLLPVEIWRDPKATFLDPACKSGVFLREITRRLVEGLEEAIPDHQKRIDHILTKQVFGLAITDLTALLARRSVYCSKTANGGYSVCTAFQDEQGNIRFDRMEHTWQNGRCTFCGAGEGAYDRSEELETHAYRFIHTTDPKEIFEMQFDVIVSNPPYQLNDGGGTGRSAIPIYHRFVSQAKKLLPRYLTMVIPSRWFAGGKGLDDFRKEMLQDDRLRAIHDFEAADKVFPGVDIAGGICYFLWCRDERGTCAFTTVSGESLVTVERRLNEFDTLIRSGEALPIVRKVLAMNENGGKRLSSRVSVRQPFGIPSTYMPLDSGTPCWFAQRAGRRFCEPSSISECEEGLLSKHKVLIPFAPIAGQTDFSKPVAFYYAGNVILAEPGEACNETYLVAGAFETRREAENFLSYLLTKTVRFLLLQRVVSQNVTRGCFEFIPDLTCYDETFSDELLIERWGITEDEWGYIKLRIA